MAKPIRRYSSLRKMRFRSRKRKSPRKLRKGIIHVQSSFSNTIVTITNIGGQVISWASAGVCGFKSRRRGTPFAAQTTAENAISGVQGMKRADVMIKGPGRGRDAALRAICRSGIRVKRIKDKTPLPHNGCRPPKKRRK
uniref:Small ribosomal subunit protein uS11c n=1 Tax=Hypseocharis bilobata TaxID=253189 RepID=V9P7Y8_9ROSI|nr:ribosomal protein S11 [Hypseocharis bilobata]AGV02942.1 ribosomal protein S11 [Hypseocharis bilobata]